MSDSCTQEKEFLQSLAARHDDILLRLDELENEICLVINEYLQKEPEKTEIGAQATT